MIEPLLKLKKEKKENNPEFIRQDDYKKDRLERKWRRPRGRHSKMRIGFKGKRRSPSPGFKMPKLVRGTHITGLKIVRVSNLESLSKILRDKEGIVVPKSVGMKKKYDILKKAKELRINILNLNIDESIKKIEETLSQRKNKKDEIKKTKEAAQEKDKKEAERKEKEKRSKDKKSEENQSSEKIIEDKKEAEKKEKDKILTHK